MKMLSMSCPNCNATLTVDDDRSRAVCEYCGHMVFIERERHEMPEQYEMGERDFAGHAAELAEKVQKLIGPVREYNQLTSSILAINHRIDAMERKQSELEKKIAFQESSFGRVLPKLSVVAVALLFLISAVRSTAAGGAVGSLLLPFVYGGMVFLGFTLHRKKQRSEYRETKSELTALVQKRSVQIDRINNVNKVYDFSFIPEKYRYEEALDYFYRAFIRNRATTIQQAVVLYEDDIERQKMEERHRQEIHELEKRYQEQVQQQYRTDKKQLRRQSRMHRKQMARNHAYQKRQLELQEAQLEELRKMNQKEEKGASMLGTVITAGAVMSAGAKIAKAIRRMR